MIDMVSGARAESVANVVGVCGEGGGGGERGGPLIGRRTSRPRATPGRRRIRPPG